MMPNVVEANLPMVDGIARSLKRRLPASQSLDELVAAGSLGLVEAAARFDAGRGSSFRAYASARVRGAMLDAMRSECPSSRGARRRSRRIQGCQRELFAKLGRPPEEEEILDALGSGFSSLEEGSFRLVSLEDLGEESGARERLELCLAEARPTALDDLIREGRRRRLERALEDLNERQRLVLSLYYFEELKLREIGEILGVTESRVCQIHGEALSILRKSLASD